MERWRNRNGMGGARDQFALNCRIEYVVRSDSRGTHFSSCLYVKIKLSRGFLPMLEIASLYHLQFSSSSSSSVGGGITPRLQNKQKLDTYVQVRALFSQFLSRSAVLADDE